MSAMFSTIRAAVFVLLLSNAIALSVGDFHFSQCHSQGFVSGYFDSWLNKTFLTVNNDSTLDNNCDYSRQAWALNALRFKNTTLMLRQFETPKPCTEIYDICDGYLGYLGDHPPQEQSRGNITEIPIRELTYGWQGCRVTAGAFVRAGPNLFAISDLGGPSLDFVQVLDAAAHNYRLIPTTTDRPFSFFMKIPTIEHVPGFMSALNKANGQLSVEESRLQEVSPSNAAILFLPVLLSFVPLSIMTDDVSKLRVIIYSIATDLITNIPVLIKGGELLYINSLRASTSAGITFSTESTNLKIVEFWETKCLKTLYAYYIGALFLLLGIWSTIVGFVTEYIVWRFVTERKGNDERLEKKLVASWDSKNFAVHGLDDNIENAILNTEDITTGKFPGADTSADPLPPENPCDDRRPITFFFVGVFLSFLCLVPFLALLFLSFEVFRKTEKRLYFFKVGIMTGSINLAFVYLLHRYTDPFGMDPLFIFILIFNVVITVALQRRTFRIWRRIVLSRPALNLQDFIRRKTSLQLKSEVSTSEESRELKFFFSGFFLGILASLVSFLYTLCFPGIRGNKKKKRMFKYGCLVGSLNNVVFVDLLLRKIFEVPHPDALTSPFIYIFNFFLIIALIITEKISP